MWGTAMASINPWASRLVAALSICLSPYLASATTVYTYIGNPYDILSDQNPPAGSYDNTMYVSGSFTVASPLAANLVSVAITPTSYTFSDGRTTFASTSPCGGCFTSFSTNAVGAITDWQISLSATSYVGNEAVGDQTYALSSDPIIDVASITECTGVDSSAFCNSWNHDSADVYLNAGLWTVSSTPLPPTFSLFATGLGVLGLLGWRRKRKGDKC
jgi:hypothetical protein